MSHYRVSFFKNCLSSDGHGFRCLQQQVDVLNNESAEQAAESAARQFEKLHGLRDWKVLADSIEVDSADRSYAVEPAQAGLRENAYRQHGTCHWS